MPASQLASRRPCGGAGAISGAGDASAKSPVPVAACVPKSAGMGRAHSDVARSASDGRAAVNAVNGGKSGPHASVRVYIHGTRESEARGC